MICRSLLRQSPSFSHVFSGNPGETSECPDKTNGGDNVSLMFFPSFAALLLSSFDNEFLGHRLIGLFPVPFVGKMPPTNRKFPQQLERE
jgi:hypothetical protein